MRGIIIILAILFWGLGGGCSKNHEIITGSPFSSGKVVSSKDGVVIRITKDVDVNFFEGVIINSPDSSQLCREVGANKNGYYPCSQCKSKC